MYYFYVLIEESCILHPGDATGGSDKYIGIRESVQGCVDLVVNKEPSANGVTINKRELATYDCFAEFGATTIDSGCSNCETCIFGMLLWLLYNNNNKNNSNNDTNNNNIIIIVMHMFY